MRGPGRPRIDPDLQALIRRMRTENFLWGAPRIHGELLKLGITVSQRTVSRYLPHRLGAPSQTWRTFLTNQLGTLTFGLTVKSLDTSSDRVIDVDAVPSCLPTSSVDASSHPAHVDAAPVLDSRLPHWRATQPHVRHATRVGSGSCKDPPQHWAA
jgi:hypothetical protein